MRKILFCLTLLLFFSPPLFSNAFSEEEEETQNIPLEDKSSIVLPTTLRSDALTVYGSRMAKPITRLDEVPANVTLKDKNDLENQTPQTFQDAVQDAEGVILFDSVGNNWDTTFGLRGFADSSSATFLVDGVRVNSVDGNFVTFPLLIMSDMDSIEIERGSASPVYGAGSFSGVVSLRTGKPSEKPVHLFGGLEFSSFQGVRFHQGVSGTVKNNHLPFGGRFTYYFDGGRFGMSEGFRDNNESRMAHFNIKSGFELPDDQGGVRVGVKHAEGYLASPGEMTFQEFVDNPKQSNKPLDFRRQDETIVQIEGDKKFWEDRLTASIMNSWRFHDQELQTTSGSFIDFTHGYDPNTDRVFQKSRERNLIWQVEYQDSWASWLSNKTSIGMEHRNGHDQALQLNAFQGVLRPLDGPDTDRNAEARNTALFWRETLGLWDRIYLYYGMRQDYHRLAVTDNITPAANLSNRWNQMSQSVGITVKPLSFLDIFSNYSQGFRVPTISDIAPFSSGINSDLQPVTSDSYEVGHRLHYKDFVSAKTSFFLIDLENEIVFDETSVTPATPFGRNTNIAASRRKGVEFRLDATPVRELYLYFSHTWTSARVRSTDSDGVPYHGRSLGQVPEHRLTFGSMAQPLKRLGEPFDGFKVAMDGIYTGKQHPEAYESTDQATLNSTGYFIKPFILWNFKISQEWKGIEIYFKVNNIFNEKYLSRAIAATSFGSSIYPPGTYLFANPGETREFVWGLKWGF